MPPTPLPVLAAAPTVGPADLVRLFHRSQLLWGRGVAEEAVLDGGTWLHNADLQPSAEASCLLDAALDPRQTPADWFDRLTAATAGSPVRGCTPNPSLPSERTAPLVDYLLAAAWATTTLDVLHLRRTRPAAAAPTGLTVIPARAALARFARLLSGRPDESLAERHLDDPHVDAWLALRDGVAVASVALLNAGDVGTVRDLYVAPPERGRGTGRLLLDRALESAARSGHRHVLAGVPPRATGLFAAAGFVVVGQWVQYVRPPVPPP